MELYNENCFDRLKKIPDKSIDLIFNDLPYCGITNSKKDSEISCKWNTPVDLEKLWVEYRRIRKNNTPIFFTCSTKFGYSLIKSNPKEFRYDIAYIKSSACGFLNSKRQPLRKHEMIYVFYKRLPFYDLSSHRHKFLDEGKKTKEDILEKSQISKKMIAGENNLYGNINGGTVGNIHGTNYEPKLPVSVVQEDILDFKKGTIDGNEIYKGKKVLYRNMSGLYDPPLPNSVLEIKSQKGKHSTQKPDALMQWILKYYSKEGDIVFDPTIGSGSMALASKKMGRKFIGCELDADIFKVALERIENE